MRILIISLVALTLNPLAMHASAEGYDNERLYQEFMGYAQEYHQDAKKHENLAALFRKMAKQKEIMAEGYRANKHHKVKQAEQEYYRLKDQVDAIYRHHK
ncbi:hypothetical protein ACFL2V_17720 [Pseudomonadota bacterium]